MHVYCHDLPFVGYDAVRSIVRRVSPIQKKFISIGWSAANEPWPWPWPWPRIAAQGDRIGLCADLTNTARAIAPDSATS